MTDSAGSIRQAILDRAQEEAQKIIDQARQRAEQTLKNAEQEKNARIEKMKLKIIEETKQELDRIQAKANIEARKTVVERKMALLAKIHDETRRVLQKREFSYNIEEFIRNSLKECLPTFPDKTDLRMYVNSRDLTAAKKVLSELKLSNTVNVESDNSILGGIIIESSDRRLRVDDSYDTRLSSYLEKRLSDVGAALFQS